MNASPGIKSKLLYNPFPNTVTSRLIVNGTIRMCFYTNCCLCYTERIKKKKKKDIIHFQYIVLLAPPYGLKPCLRDHEFYILRRALRGHQNHKSSFSQLCIGVEKI